jgi:hypothetical protein
MAPFERVRMAVAPSTDVVLVAAAPLMLNHRYRDLAVVVEAAADDARLQAGYADGVAAVERQLPEILGLDGLAQRDVGLGNVCSAVTVTFSLIAPADSEIPVRSRPHELDALLTAFLKPCSSAVML